jgi:hypothetical protein
MYARRDPSVEAAAEVYERDLCIRSNLYAKICKTDVDDNVFWAPLFNYS